MLSNHIYTSIEIVGLSHVRAKQCTSTPSLQMVEFLDREMPNFMTPCCLELAR